MTVTENQKFEFIADRITIDRRQFFTRQADYISPRKKFIVLFTGRTGSSWLSQLLGGYLGYPEEYLNPDLIALTCESLNAVTVPSFFNALFGLRSTPNGVFGIEVTAEHIAVVGEDRFFAFIKNPTVLFLWRRNLIAQGISLYRAVKTRRFHSNELLRVSTPDYEPKEIESWIRYLLYVENLNADIIVSRKLDFNSLVYEEMVIDPEATFRKVCTAIGQDMTRVDFEEVSLRVISDDWNKEAELRFRSDNPELAQMLEAERKLHQLLHDKPVGHVHAGI